MINLGQVLPLIITGVLLYRVFIITRFYCTFLFASLYMYIYISVFAIHCILDEPETRDEWWIEVRNEIKSHYRAMGCNAVIGYSENTSIW